MGMRIGYGTSAKENTIAVMSWQEAESHIRAMVENGTYMSANEVFLVDAVERERIATDINNFFRDGISEMPESLELKFSDYQASMERLCELLSTTEGTYTDKKEAGAALIDMCRSAKQPNMAVTIGEYQGFKMSVSFDSFFSKFKAVTLDNDIAPTLFRKLKNISALIDKAIEIEDFQAIGVQCREILIELGNSIYTPEMAGDEEQPQASNFKKKAELFIKFYMSGSGNSEYRSIIKKMTEGTWDYACKITHSQTATFYEVSTCVSLTISLVSMYENVRQKSLDPISQFQCPNCKSKKFNVTDSEHDENGVISKLFLQCEECGEVTQIDFIEK